MKKMSCCAATIGLLLLSFSATAVDLTASLPSRLSDIKAGERQIELLGTAAVLQQQAPDFKVADQAFKAVKLSDFSGKTVLLSVVPSLDTGVCSIQTKKFNQEVAALPADVVVMTISTDLPFAQKRFCVQEKVDKLLVLSDAVWGDFGSSYGLRIKDMGILSRAVLIIDPSGKLVYQQLVPSLGQEPDYAAALTALKTVTAKKS
ncbi:thiol peroxidase [Rheinheimera riviphila]|uniref:Thiol peroxidase n=1 Tax=Rheinheimera riviphila TaxID=1834037 RepID=A0A437R185_9GAMM|nr:thiol peroxidase [Rheinheimera riviphila]RVU40522.1 thiol peroxidase [Rheinheimera riviphila]